jgi:AcrR family transcriptional regulator
MAVKSRRGGRPSRREIAAEATRQEILAAARRLFVERGYLQTSMGDIADEAGVSIPTIYASVGPKAAVVRALAATIEPGAEVPTARSRVMAEDDPVELLRVAARVARQLQEGFGDIIAALTQAASGEPEIASSVEAGRQMHVAGSRMVAERLSELDVLRQGVSVDEAADVIAFLADIETVGRLVRQHGWTFDRAETWVSEALIRLLLPEQLA